MPAARDITNRRFGRLVALECVRRGGRDGRLWRCQCECGREHVVDTYSLTSGNTKSCGCNRYGHGSKPKHGHAAARTPTYRAWHSMRQRCRHRPEYGAVSIDPRWNDFRTFLAEMGERPTGMTLDRIDNRKGYSRHNCRWATPKTQTRNRTCALVAFFRGRATPLQDIADALGMTYSAVVHRYRRGQPFEGPRRFLTPDEVREIRRRKAAGEKTVTLSKEFGISHSSAWLIVTRRSYPNLEDTDSCMESRPT